MKKLVYILLFGFYIGFGQNKDNRIQNIQNQLEALFVDNNGLTEQVKTEISVNNITLSNFLLGISNVHNVNINIGPGLESITLINNFSNVTVADVLIFLCKEYNLTIDFTGNILSIKTYEPPIEVPEERTIPIVFEPQTQSLTLDAKGDKLYQVFKGIMDKTGKNLVFSPGMASKLITAYIKNMPFDTAMEQISLSNNLLVEKSKDGFYLFDEGISGNGNQPKRRLSNVDFKILDYETQLLAVDLIHTPIVDIIEAVAAELNLNVFTATPLDEAGTVTFKTQSISFDDLLSKMFESQTVKGINQKPLDNPKNRNPQETSTSEPLSKTFTFKKEGNIYFFGIENQLSVRKTEIIHLYSRTVEMFADPSGGMNRNRTVGRTGSGYRNYGNSGYNSNYNNTYTNQFDNGYGNNNNRLPVNTNNYQNFSSTDTKGEALLSVLPDEIKQDLDIKVDLELNSFYVMGSAAKIERFKTFIKKIDKPVPVILIEVMLIEVSRNATVETGVGWGIGDESKTSSGSIFPETDLTLGAKTINKVLNGFDGFGHINLGKVVPNFFATIKAMEANGNVRIRSTPKLSTLNGHRATFSNGQTSYYAVTQRNIYGTDNPQTSEITNYEPIDAELGLTIKPLVSGDGQVTLDIFVVQSSFGARVADDSPPDLSSREFSSIIRVQDQDIVVLGGLEEQLKNDSGTGVPLLARVPVIKWLFSKRKREDSKSKLTVLIKPTVIY